MDFMFTGLDHGVNSISDGGGPLIPFLMTQVGERRELKRFITERYEEGIASAEKTLRELTPKPDFALIAFDGFITWEEKKYDAIFVRAFNKNEDQGFQFCQRYIPKQEGTGIEPVGNAAFVGKTENLIRVLGQPSTQPEAEVKSKRPWWKF